MFAWGNNEYGQLGVVSDQPQLPLPQPLESSALERGVVNIAAGGAFTGFLTSKTLLLWRAVVTANCR